MPVFLAALLGGLINIAGTLAGRVLVGLGISVITYTGLNTSLDWLKSQAVGAFSGLPAELVGMIAYVGVGQAISIIVSAITVRFTLDGLTDGTFKKWVLK